MGTVVIRLESAPQGLRGHLSLWMVEISSGVYVGDSTPGFVRDSGNESSRNSVRAERRWHGIPSISYMSAAKTERRR